ncbi:MAG: UDP-N-acetylmuramate--L-alanine ligase [Cryomorphaceae bacterium]|nr:UDP-N-acetylmuramate--L-alanine ligase [Cryomorphaceae bacterium]
MIRLTELEVVYFIGIGGIGMSALARYFHQHGKTVMGYDRTSSPLTTELEMEGISVHFSDMVNDLPHIIRHTPKEKQLIVYTPAIPSNHGELNWFRDNGYAVHKRSEVLGWITNQGRSIAVAGTHGKTTTSSFVAHLLYSSDHGCNAFLGGITSNYSTNFLFSSADAWNVIEADEYDRSFLALTPEIAVITSIDPDHLDIYGTAEEMRSTYRDFAKCVKAGGILLLNDQIDTHGFTDYRTYGLSDHADFRCSRILIEGAKTYFDFVHPEGIIEDLEISMPGFHNLNNACAAITVAVLRGVDANNIKQALKSFRGIARRYEYRVNSENHVYIDDYAHHPTEITATIQAARASYPNKKITGIFQPHLFSRTRDFGDEFAESLDLLDKIILLDIYPAREEPISGIDSQWLLDKIVNSNKKLVSKTQLLDALKSDPPEVLLTLGAGDIDRLVGPIGEWMKTL